VLALAATLEGDPATGLFSVRFTPASGGIQASIPNPPDPDPQTLSVATKLFQLLDALDPPTRPQKAAPLKVFLLRYRKNLSLTEIARTCKCARSLVALRFKTI
jgi:DNA-directed RNA polymerase specialized sigma24 family protein